MHYIKLGSYFIQIPIFKYHLTRNLGVRTLAGSLISCCDGSITKQWKHAQDHLCINQKSRQEEESEMSSNMQMDWYTQQFSSGNIQ